VTALSFFGSTLTTISVVYFVSARWWSAFILIPLTVSALAALASLLTTMRRRRDALSSHRLLVDRWRPCPWPSVDVFLPSAGEPLAVLANTYRHVALLAWKGGLQVYVLDDSARRQVRDLAARHGFAYLSRPDRGHLKKAGNLRYGYDNSRGELIAILDADFVPRADFLTELSPTSTRPTSPSCRARNSSTPRRA